MKTTKLPPAINSTPANQCRAWGLVVGDTIIGREDQGCHGWNEAKLTVLWIGLNEVMFSEKNRTRDRRRWNGAIETSDWYLVDRNWCKVLVLDRAV